MQSKWIFLQYNCNNQEWVKHISGFSQLNILNVYELKFEVYEFKYRKIRDHSLLSIILMNLHFMEIGQTLYNASTN